MKIKENVKKHMQKREPEWWKPEDDSYWKFWREAKQQREKIGEIIEKYIGPIELLLDIGCGQGRMLFLASKAVEMVLLDINKKMVLIAKGNAGSQRIANVDFILADAEHILIRTGSASLVVCLQTLIHLPNREKALNEFSRITKDDATLILDIPLQGIIEYIIWSLRFGGIRNLFTDTLKRLGLSTSYSHTSNKREFKVMLRKCNLYIKNYFKVGPWDTFILKKEK